MRKWLLFLIGLDLFLLVMHFWVGFDTPLWNLDVERNIPTIYQAVKMAVVGLLLLFRRSKMWVLGLAILYVGIDEGLEIHEHSETYLHQIWPWMAVAMTDWLVSIGYHSSYWMVIYSPIVLVFGLYLLLVFPSRDWSVWKILLPSIVCFGLVVVVEYLTSQGQMSPTEYHLWVGFEELFEKVGATNLIRLLAWKPGTRT
jgi:hypothetical protein